MTPIETAQLSDLANEYHVRAEAFDRTVCTGPIVRGGIMPATPEQLLAISRNAIALFSELGVKAASLGFSPEQWREAVRSAANQPQ